MIQAQNQTSQPTPQASGDRITTTFSPVTVTETIGVTCLGLLSLILTFALLRAMARNRKLERKIDQTQGKRLLDLPSSDTV
jgi:hypothetical protein